MRKDLKQKPLTPCGVQINHRRRSSSVYGEVKILRHGLLNRNKTTLPWLMMMFDSYSHQTSTRIYPYLRKAKSDTFERIIRHLQILQCNLDLGRIRLPTFCWTSEWLYWLLSSEQYMLGASPY